MTRRIGTATVRDERKVRLHAERPKPPKRQQRGGRGIRRERGKMNGTEKAYSQHLDERKQSGEVLDYWFEGIKFRLADGAYYTPDFLVLLADLSLEVHEIKGHWEEAARVRIKVAAETFPFVFKALRRIPKKRGGGWDVEAI